MVLPPRPPDRPFPNPPWPIGLLTAAFGACPTTPTPYAPWAWGITIIVIVVLARRPRLLGDEG